MASRPLAILLGSLSLALLIGAPGAFAHGPTAAPEESAAWLGTATGVELLHVSGSHGHWRHRSRGLHEFEVFDQDVSLDGEVFQMTSKDGAEEWVGSVEVKRGRHVRHARHHGLWRTKRARGEHVHVVFDESALAAIADHLADRIADASADDELSAENLRVSIRGHRVKLAANPEEMRFWLAGRISFEVREDGSRRVRRGFYAFRAGGEMEPLPEQDEPPPEPPAPPAPLSVLLLGDNGSEPQVAAALEGAGYAVTTLARYADWDGVTPSAADFDVIVYLDGLEFGVGLAPAADAALADFVARGGGLVRTEWSLWAGVVNPLSDPLMPLRYAGMFRYGTRFITYWTVVQPDHPLTTGVAPSWRELGDYSLATPDPTATVVVRTDDGWPLVTAGSDAGGTVVHINHALTYRGLGVLDPNVLQLFVNAVAFASAR